MIIALHSQPIVDRLLAVTALRASVRGATTADPVPELTDDDRRAMQTLVMHHMAVLAWRISPFIEGCRIDNDGGTIEIEIDQPNLSSGRANALLSALEDAVGNAALAIVIPHYDQVADAALARALDMLGLPASAIAYVRPCPF